VSDETQAIDDATAADNARWFHDHIMLPVRRGVVRGLLAGNDCQCFGTEQYKAAWTREMDRLFKVRNPLPPELVWLPGVAEGQLRSTGLVREVEPGVWAPAERGACRG